VRSLNFCHLSDSQIWPQIKFSWLKSISKPNEEKEPRNRKLQRATIFSLSTDISFLIFFYAWSLRWQLTTANIEVLVCFCYFFHFFGCKNNHHAKSNDLTWSFSPIFHPSHQCLPSVKCSPCDFSSCYEKSLLIASCVLKVSFCL